MANILEKATYEMASARWSPEASRNRQAGILTLHGCEVVLFRFRQLVDLPDVGVGELLYLFETIALVVFRNLFLFQHLLQTSLESRRMFRTAVQVIKKWLSYREHKLLGRPLTTDEAREVMNIARRIASILLLEPSLDANYQAIKGATYPWPFDQ